MLFLFEIPDLFASPVDIESIWNDALDFNINNIT